MTEATCTEATSAPTRICFPFVGDDVGGSHISVLGLLEHLDRRRFDPIIALHERDGNLERLFGDADVPIVTAPAIPHLAHGAPIGPFKMVELMMAQHGIGRALAARGVDIVHTNDGRTHAAWAVAAKIAGARLIWHQRQSPRARGVRFVAPLLADAVISVSQFAEPGATPLMRRPLRQVIHSPFDTGVREDREAARAALVNAIGCKPETRIIGFFGAFTARKRPLLFVETAAAIAAAAPELPFKALMFGREYDVTHKAIEARAAGLAVSDRVIQMGFRSPPSRWLAACDLLLVPAVDEPFGRTLIEAMLVGTPVIATRSGGNCEALRGGASGLLVEPECARALADASLSLLADDDGRARLAAAAKTDALRRFGASTHAEAVMAVYAAVLNC